MFSTVHWVLVICDCFLWLLKFLNNKFHCEEIVDQQTSLSSLWYWKALLDFSFCFVFSLLHLVLCSISAVTVKLLSIPSTHSVKPEYKNVVTYRNNQKDMQESKTVFTGTQCVVDWVCWFLWDWNRFSYFLNRVCLTSLKSIKHTMMLVQVEGTLFKLKVNDPQKRKEINILLCKYTASVWQHTVVM